MDIDIKTIPHSEQRYPTCGDYWWDNGIGSTLHVRISKLGRIDWEFLILVHELIEWFLCYIKGIDINAVDAFDREFEKNRAEGNTDEPGNDPKAPYHTEHVIATAFERLLSFALAVDWDAYEAAVNRL